LDRVSNVDWLYDEEISDPTDEELVDAEPLPDLVVAVSVYVRLAPTPAHVWADPV
jgi:hypothetical protein